MENKRPKVEHQDLPNLGLFSVLPWEIFEEIMSFVVIDPDKSFARTCKAFAYYTKQTEKWRFRRFLATPQGQIAVARTVLVSLIMNDGIRWCSFAAHDKWVEISSGSGSCWISYAPLRDMYDPYTRLHIKYTNPADKIPTARTLYSKMTRWDPKERVIAERSILPKAPPLWELHNIMTGIGPGKQQPQNGNCYAFHLAEFPEIIEKYINIIKEITGPGLW